MKKIYILIFPILFCGLLSFISCSEKSTDPVNDGNGNNNVETTIYGKVLDESNIPVSGAEVTAHGVLKITGEDGSFLFSKINVPKERFVVNAFKAGYFKSSAAEATVKNGTSSIRIFLISADITQTISASSGGEAKIQNGSGVKLEANSISKADGSDYTGNVNVSVAYLDPTSENFSDLIPGGDLLAQRTDNSEVTLYSYGIIKVEMKDDAGQELKIKTGNQSEITVDIPPDMVGSAPSTIPLWHYDNSTGLWKEEGTAVKQGDKYVGLVGHFSDWNCDVPEGTSTIRGLVIDCNQLPVSGIRVKIGQAGATTGADGRFERRVPANTSFEVQVLGSANFGLSSNPVSVPPLAEGTMRDVGSLEIDCPSYITGLIKCDNEIKFGQVTVTWDGGFNSQFTDAQGKFRLAADINKNANISIYTFDNKYKNIAVTTPSNRGDSLNLGTIEVCDEVQMGDNEFTLNGSGFNNKTFKYNSSTENVFGYYSPEDSMTYIGMHQVFNTDTLTMIISFKGTTVGAASNVMIILWHDSTSYLAYPEFLPNTAASVNVTKYSGIGGLIEGTFSGSLIDFSNNSSITLTNGKFSVIRIVGEKAVSKISGYKIKNDFIQKFKLRM